MIQTDQSTKPASRNPLLKSLELHWNNFQFLSSEALSDLESLIQINDISKGKDLQPVGFTCRTIYFVLQGIARIYYYQDGKDITESFASENEMIVRVESLFTGRASRKGIQAIEHTRFAAMDAHSLFQLFDKHRDLERLFRKLFEKSHVDLVNRLEGIQFHTAQQRYLALLEEVPDIIQRVPLKYIASYLGISAVSLSRIRARRD